MAMRNRSSIRSPDSGNGTNGTNGTNGHHHYTNGDGKYGAKKGIHKQLMLWAAVSIVVLILFVHAVSDETHDGSRGRGGLMRSLKKGKTKKNKSGVKISSSTRVKSKDLHLKTPCPEEFKRTFWVEKKKINQPPTRAMRAMGWRTTDNPEEAQIIWTYVSTTSWYDQLKPWQRYNHIPNYKLWNQKDTFVTYMLDYGKKSGKPLPSVPETYRLDEADGLEQFRKRLFQEGGLSIPWVLKKPNVNQGKGITMLGPNSEELKNVLKLVEEEKEEQNYIIQRYVCNEMTIDQRKFDFRIFWIVASLDPLIIMYHDGYVRIGNAAYNENDFSNTRAHLTTHTGMAAEGKGTWDEFKDYITEAAKANPKLSKKVLKDPVLHVKNQVKQVLGEMGAAFKEATFNNKRISSENGFGFYGGDFIIDWDLDVFFIEPQHGCGLDEDHQFRVDMHNELFSEMVVAVEEIWTRQEKGYSLENKYLEHTGGYEVVYNDGWMFEYKGYKPAKDKKGCEIAKKK